MGKPKTSILSTLYKRRTVITSRLDKFELFLEGLDPQNIPIGEFRIRLSKIKDTWNDFQTIQSEIEEQVDDPDSIIIEDELRDEFESKYYVVVARGDELLSPAPDHLPPPQSLSSTPSDVRLPPISLPTFSGQFDQWTSFFSMFKELVHENRLYQDPIKLKYLKNSLRGEAYAVVESLELTANNYFVAIQLLKDRYDNPTRAVLKHVRELFDIPKIDKQSATNIRSLLDTSQKHIRSLKALGQPTDTWDTLLIHLITNKLDAVTYKEWQNKIPPKELPDIKLMFEFLEHQCQVLDALNLKLDISLHSKNRNNSNSHKSDRINNPSRCFLIENTTTKPCILCNESHLLHKCPKFGKMTVYERFSYVKSNQLCINCLKKSHRVSDCKSSYRCNVCKSNHNSLLHRTQSFENSSNSIDTTAHTVAQMSPSSDQNHADSNPHLVNPVTYTSVVSQPSVVLLSTANVLVYSSNGKQITCRALLDCGSQSSFMTAAVCDRLGLKKRPINMSVNGFVNSSHTICSHTEAKIASKVSNYSRTVDFLIVPKITDYIPQINFDIRNLFLPSNIVLADSNFQNQDEIELLIGADIFWELIGTGEFQLPHFSLTLRETKLGWIFAGKSTVSLTTHCHLISNATLESLDMSIRKFWEVEQVEPSCDSFKFTPEERECEDHYKSTVSRNQDGRYVVRIPLKNSPTLLGDSREIAVRRFHGLEKRFEQNLELKIQYQKFIDEYIALGHMKEIDSSEIKDSNVYFVPHHPVFKESSTTTKIRVVFDFSCKTTSGYSLNDISSVGPTIQSSLYSHLIRSRTYPILICGDIEKMYRQVLIDPDQTQLQLIVWRNSPKEPLKIYRLLTVSYGNSSASWLSTRTLQQLTIDHPYPRSSEIIQNHFYVDDLITGCRSVEEAKHLRTEVSAHLALGGLNIRKWCSNSLEFVNSIPESDREVQSSISFDDSCVRTLGLIWLPTEDSFSFSFDQVKFEDPDCQITKRHLFSSIAKLFDPIGLLGPVIAKAKILMQDLWRQEYDWDEPLSSSLCKKWKIFGRSMLALKELRIPRQLVIGEYSRIEIHGFADASTVAYGACVYLRSIDCNGNAMTRLITSKSRVAPLKSQTLPRLELLAAVLLVNLVEQVTPSLSNFKIDDTFFWTDSRVALSWINGTPSKWTTFVANRVSRIQEFSQPDQWRHVPTQFNPADHISRGLYADQLMDNTLWWYGPHWLSQSRPIQNYGNFDPILDEELPEVSKPKRNALISANFVLNKSHMVNVLTKYSSFDKLVRIVAYCYRFLRIRRYPKGSRPIGPISATEFSESKLRIILIAQNFMFSQEHADLSSGKNVKTSSILASLNPFLDGDKLIRVGGRLTESSLTPDKKHPIVLLHGGSEPINKLTFIIARQIHTQNSHAGPQALLSMIREQYWPINGRNLTRKVFHKCVDCYKANPKPLEQGMGNLPKPRVEPSRPFYYCGLDFAGPIMIRSSNLRNASRCKSYISLFICLSTKAIHIQLVEDLSTDSFLAALKCFMSRRGKPHTIYCDNATNFVGASNELESLMNLWLSDTHKNTIVNFLAKDCIQWKFIPPRSPNFGGLWESGVKLVKTHLHRIIGSKILTFNELYTVLTQIESCLNSRPLFPMSSNPIDLTALTPAHFLIGSSLIAPPEPSLLKEQSNRLSRWQFVQQTVQHFWKRWSTEYLQELQRRNKWKTTSSNIACGALVLIKNDQAPPSSWTLGRVQALHPGPDGVVRVVTLKTTSGLFKRNVRLLCPLPVTEDIPFDSSLKIPLQGGEDMDEPVNHSAQTSL